MVSAGHLGLRMEYAELLTLSNFSFLKGASHPEELIKTAAELNYSAIGLCDENSVAGIIRGLRAAKELPLRYHPGARIAINYKAGIKDDGPCRETIWLALYPTDKSSYQNLCALITLGRSRFTTSENNFELQIEEYYKYQKGLLAIIIHPAYSENRVHSKKDDLNFLQVCQALKEHCCDSALLSIALARDYQHSPLLDKSILRIATQLNISLVASNNVLYHSASRRPLQDTLTCIRNRTTILEAGFLLTKNSERFLKTKKVMAYLFRDLPSALKRSVELSDMLNFSPADLKYEYPDSVCPHGKSTFEYLSELTEQGLKKRYPQGVPLRVKDSARKELILIRELAYEKYFLTCYDIVKFARDKGILCQGRGAAANSVVCFSLEITAVDPEKINLLFARFVSKERAEPPDIDIDFEHERREEVIQYIYSKYGTEHAALTAEVVTYRARSAVRDVGKALGLSLQVLDRLAKSIHHWTGSEISPDFLQELGINYQDQTIKHVLGLTEQLQGFPRHLSQHVGGFIISQNPLSSIVPVLNAPMSGRRIIEWDKDDIEELGILKIDVLALGMLSCIRKALDYINQRRLREDQDKLSLYSIPSEDPKVYQMVSAADTIGVFQIESRAQMSMLPRLKPRCFYDLVIEIAIVRPGPIHGDMVHPYLRRRSGIEKVNFPDQHVKAILGKTLGIPLFQEQAMRLAITLAGFSPGEAEKLRRAMAAWKKNKELIETFKQRIIKGMTEKGYSLKFAETCMNQLKGFSEYGFPESHAASFAHLVYASAWIKRFYPAEFTAALLNSQPMGFYAAAQIINDLKNPKIKENKASVLPIDINKSQWDCALEKDLTGTPQPYALRLGMRMVRGLHRADAEIIIEAVRSYGSFLSIFELWQKTYQKGLRRSALKLLAKADAFTSFALNRREALWEIQALPEAPLPLEFKPEENGKSEAQKLPLMPEKEAVFCDYESYGTSLRNHPLRLIRSSLPKQVRTASELARERNYKNVEVAGLVIIRQRPGTAKGVVFLTLEDETGIVNLIIKPALFQRFSKTILSSSCLLAKGLLQKVGEVIYVSVDYLEAVAL